MSQEGPDYVKDLGDLMKLKDSAGWKLLVVEHKRRLDDLTVQVLEPTTPAHEAEPLRQARGRLDKDFKPEDILSNLIDKTKALATKQLEATGARTKTP